MIAQKNSFPTFFDATFPEQEQLPRTFVVSFKEVGAGAEGKVCVVLDDDNQIGDIINDNAHENDFYRYHDIFHYAFATMLGWSPCARSMMKRKRKSISIIDEMEDGARATITEEALSLIIFNEAKRKNFFNNAKVSKVTLRIIKEMTEPFEVHVRTEKDWQTAILKAYDIFRLLIKHGGGRVEFNALKKEICYFSLN
jgi:hypothetical protein